MKFSIVAVATVALAGLASAAPSGCLKTVTAAADMQCDSFSRQNGVDLHVFQSLNFDPSSINCHVVKGQEYCVDAGKTFAKRCHAEKKKQEEKPKEEKPKQEKPKQEEKPKKPVSGAPSEHAIPRSETSGLKLVNKINPNCQWYYTILPEDGGCQDVADKNNIDVNDLYSLNKNLHSKAPNTCDNLDTGKTYCVAL